MGRVDSAVVIACAVGPGWALPLAVLLQSAEAHLAPGRRLSAFVIDGGLDEDERGRVEASVGARTRIEWVGPAAFDLTGLPTWGRVSPVTYARLTVGRALPRDVSRVLWLDCDLLILGDLATLFDADLDGALALAVPDPLVGSVSSPFGVRVHRSIGLAPDAPYFNAGVIVLDLDAWRAGEIERQAIAYLRRHVRSVFFFDQDALNAVLANRWSALDAHWNWSAHPIHAPVRELGRPAPSILHFTGARKPWSYGGAGPWHELYLEAVDATAWRGARVEMGSWKRLVLGYERSSLRRISYPLENLWLWLQWLLTRRRLDASDLTSLGIARHGGA